MAALRSVIEALATAHGGRVFNTASDGFMLEFGSSLAAVAPAMVPAQPKSAEPLLAVLPFDNLSDDREMQFFSDGVSDEIIQRLSRGAQMKVIGRT